MLKQVEVVCWTEIARLNHQPPDTLSPMLHALYSVTERHTWGIQFYFLTNISFTLVFFPPHTKLVLPSSVTIALWHWFVFMSLNNFSESNVLGGYSWSGRRQTWGLFVIGNYSLNYPITLPPVPSFIIIWCHCQKKPTFSLIRDLKSPTLGFITFNYAPSWLNVRKQNILWFCYWKS